MANLLSWHAFSFTLSNIVVFVYLFFILNMFSYGNWKLFRCYFCSLFYNFFVILIFLSLLEIVQSIWTQMWWSTWWKNHFVETYLQNCVHKILKMAHKLYTYNWMEWNNGETCKTCLARLSVCLYFFQDINFRLLKADGEHAANDIKRSSRTI